MKEKLDYKTFKSLIYVSYFGQIFQTLNVHQLLRSKAIQSSHTFAKDNVNGLLNRGPGHLKVANKIMNKNNNSKPWQFIIKTFMKG